MSESDFALAIDVGNSRAVAAVVHNARDARDSPVLFSLSADDDSASSAVFVDEGGALFFGDTAEELGAATPGRLIREFAHDVGDDVPLVVGEHAVTADELFARLCAWIVDEVTAAEGGRPALITVTHPTSWGGHRLARVRAALERVGIDEPLLITESEASATSLEDSHPLEPGALLAVYDLGGTRFDARVLRRRSEGRYQPVGEQVRIEHLGGANFDDALLRHVMPGVALGDDDAFRLAIAGMRREVVRAKELLSSAGDATVQLVVPTGTASVRVTRSEFESMIDADLDRTVDALDLAIESADAQVDRIEAIVLVGGSSRIPLVAQRLSERFDLPIVADTDPQASAALGAARIARSHLHDVDTVPGTAIAKLAGVEKNPAPKPAPASERAGILAFLRPLIGKPSRSTSPLLLAGAAVFIAVTIVFSSTTAAGTRWPDYVQAAASDLLNLPKPSRTPAPAATTPVAAPPSATGPEDEQVTTPVNRANRGPEDSQTTPARKSSRTPTSPTTPSTNGGGGPKAAPSSPPTAPPAGTPAVIPVSTDDPTTPDPGQDVPPPETPPVETPPVDPAPAENPPTETPPAENPPTETTPETTPPVEPVPPAVDPPVVTPLAEPAPVDEPAPAPGPVPEPV